MAHARERELSIRTRVAANGGKYLHRLAELQSRMLMDTEV